MVAYNFQKQFAPDVESGNKNQTIRKAGKRKPPKIGDQLQLYTGMRTKSCHLLMRGICAAVKDIKIIPKLGEVHLKLPHDGTFFYRRNSDALQKLVARDGFKSIEDFFAWFEKQVDENGIFEGHLIEW